MSRYYETQTEAGSSVQAAHIAAPGAMVTVRCTPKTGPSPSPREHRMPRRTFALTLTAYLLLRARNGLQRLLLAHGHRAQARGQYYPRDWTWE